MLVYKEKSSWIVQEDSPSSTNAAEKGFRTEYSSLSNAVKEEYPLILYGIGNFNMIYSMCQ